MTSWSLQSREKDSNQLFNSTKVHLAITSAAKQGGLICMCVSIVGEFDLVRKVRQGFPEDT